MQVRPTPVLSINHKINKIIKYKMMLGELWFVVAHGIFQDTFMKNLFSFLDIERLNLTATVYNMLIYILNWMSLLEKHMRVYMKHQFVVIETNTRTLTKASILGKQRYCSIPLLNISNFCIIYLYLWASKLN